MPSSVSPGFETARYAAMFADAPECACTFACSAAKICFTRSRANSSATSTNSQPP